MNEQDRRGQAMKIAAEAFRAAQAGHVEEALALFDQAISLDPTASDAYHNRGLAHKMLGNYRAAIADFTEAIRLAPHASSYEQRGTCYALSSDLAAAKRDLLQALRIESRRSLALAALGEIAWEEQQPGQAVDYLSRAIDIEPTAAAYFVRRAFAYIVLGECGKAVADLHTATELVNSGRDTSQYDLAD